MHMKKLVTLVLILLCILGITGCQPQAMTLQQKFPEYYNLSTFKGLEVYVWQVSEDNYYCGLMTGTNRLKTEEEKNSLIRNGATIEEMKAILSSYDISRNSISIIPIVDPSSDYDYEINREYWENIRNIFWET